jgi:hypothetical protein
MWAKAKAKAKAGSFPMGKVRLSVANSVNLHYVRGITTLEMLNMSSNLASSLVICAAISLMKI